MKNKTNKSNAMALEAKKAIADAASKTQPSTSSPKTIEQAVGELESELRSRMEQAPKLEAALQQTRDRINVLSGMIAAYRSLSIQPKKEG